MNVLNHFLHEDSTHHWPAVGVVDNGCIVSNNRQRSVGARQSADGFFETYLVEIGSIAAVRRPGFLNDHPVQTARNSWIGGICLVLQVDGVPTLRNCSDAESATKHCVCSVHLPNNLEITGILPDLGSSTAVLDGAGLCGLPCTFQLNVLRLGDVFGGVAVNLQIAIGGIVSLNYEVDLLSRSPQVRGNGNGDLGLHSWWNSVWHSSRRFFVLDRGNCDVCDCQLALASLVAVYCGCDRDVVRLLACGRWS